LLFPARVDRFANSSRPFGQHPVVTLSDAAVICSSIDDPAAFATIFDRHAGSIHRFLARRVEPAAADGLLGDVFRIAFERRESFDQERSSARPWLYGIATNVIARHRRSEHRRLRALARLASAREADYDDLVGDRVSEAIDADGKWAQLVEVIDDLPPDERDTLLLYAWEELSYSDIAAALDVPVGTVRSRLNRARRRLRALHEAGSLAPPRTNRIEPNPEEASR
jgi:RNA polymerase sigma factor (sigma-70 family)